MGQAMSAIAPIMQAVTGVSGTIGNIIQGNRQNQIQQQALSQEKQLAALSSNPALLAAKIQSLQQPLNQGLVSSVGNQTQGLMAERGLGGSPQLNEEVLAQALGPYQLNEQQMAMQALFQSLGLPLQALNVAQGTMQPPTDTSSFWQSLQKPQSPIFSTGSGGSGGSLSMGSGDSGLDPSSAVPGIWPGFLDQGGTMPGSGDLYSTGGVD